MSAAAARFLMCPPDFFRVEYEINPWMRGQKDLVLTEGAAQQWHALHALLTGPMNARVDLMTAQPGLPDLVFTANAALVRGADCLLSRFRFAERSGEEPHFGEWFTQNGFTVTMLPEGIAFEGAGDALFDLAEPNRLWAACGFRSDNSSHAYLARHFDCEVISLKLADPRFYHLDTCFCPLPGGKILWFPPAFDGESQERINLLVPAENRIAVSEKDASDFVCNAVVAGDAIAMNECSPTLRSRLETEGFRVLTTSLTEFLRAGGSSKCLTLRLDDAV